MFKKIKEAWSLFQRAPQADIKGVFFANLMNGMENGECMNVLRIGQFSSKFYV